MDTEDVENENMNIINDVLEVRKMVDEFSKLLTEQKEILD